jgi:indolepyruvate ferredoxin oxidoreductase
MTIALATSGLAADRYEDDGRAYLNGTQALVRVIADQMRADRAAGLDTGAFVSGYPGSPLGGFDQELERHRAQAERLGVIHRPGQNEELGATAVWGSQLAPGMPGARRQGVLGVWYGKAPGVDRAGDALRHGNFCGAHPLGGLVAYCGDDPSCKSSSVPSASERLLSALHMPVVYPGTVQELLDLGRHAVAASRASGLWVAVKAVTAVTDATGAVEVGPFRVVPVMPVVEDRGAPYRHKPDATLLAPWSLEMERTLTGPRTELVLAYARENGLNQITGPPDARIGVVAAGTAYHDVREALHRLGVDPERVGVRLLKLGMIWPVEPGIVRRFARGLAEILVVEEKTPLIEEAVRNILYGTADAPRVLGKHDERGAPLVPATGALDADLAARILARRLRANGVTGHAGIERGLALLDRPAPLRLLGPARTPFFCSGCPHNRSTLAPEGAHVGVGIGCHTMVVLNREGKGELTGMTQMGGEGAQWIGQAPFTELPHIFQNLGDGTFHHSGSLAIRAAVGAGVNITYKLLYNGAVAMTGGQDVTAALPVPELTWWLQAEGVRRVVVTTDEPGRYRGVRLAPIAAVRDRAELDAAQRELAATPGVTVLIHDQACAAEQRRMRGAGLLPRPQRRVAVNERVCEGCGDCGRKSSCLSVLPVETEFGRKTRIHQSSCNSDHSCLDGDCPSFLFVTGAPASRRPPRPPRLPPADPPAEADIRLVGIGGTGVVTVARVLGLAALLDGKRARGLDQTGLAQKGGAVVSDLRVFTGGPDRPGRLGTAGADVYLALDLVGAVDPRHLAAADRDRTVAVASTTMAPTGDMVLGTARHVADPGGPVAALETRTRAGDNVYLDAEALAQALFGDHMPANTIVAGAAWQSGLLPVSLEAVERAIELTAGRSAETTLLAFHWGRAAVAAPDRVARLLGRAAPGRAFDRTADAAPGAVPDGVAEPGGFADLVGFAAEGSELRRLLAVRVADLAAYQNRRHAARYAEAVRAVHERAPGAITETYARQLHRLMAYKDEYEVARLLLDPAERARIAAEFGPGARVSYLLHPPLLRALGLKRKIRVDSRFDPLFRLLYGMRRLRGTRLDPFGLTAVRRVERALPDEYTTALHRALDLMTPATERLVAELAGLPDLIRGYEGVKLAGVAAYRERAAALLAELAEG